MVKDTSGLREKNSGRDRRDQGTDDRERRGGDGHHRANEKAGRHGERDEARIAQSKRSGRDARQVRQDAGRGDVAAHHPSDGVRREDAADAGRSKSGRRRHRATSDRPKGTKTAASVAEFAGGRSCKSSDVPMTRCPTSRSQGAKPQLPTRRSIRGLVDARFMVDGCRTSAPRAPTRARAQGVQFPEICRTKFDA